jgi:tRNA nucleotidyltransferase (CCA-adding enzyme)
MLAGPQLLERLSELPGGTELLALAQGREDVELVGGAVRDLLLEGTPRELDVVVGRGADSFAQDAPEFARELAGRVGAGAPADEHERFGTALVRWQGGRVDVATRRSESYAAPGALPVVAWGTPEQDLARRDFTVNAIALGLGGTRRGVLRHVPEALSDLRAGRLRVLHARSFSEDPTRLLRLARYAARLGFAVETETAGLAAATLADGALATVSGGRIGAELRLALAEADPVASLAQAERLALLGALHPRLRFEQPLVRRALALLPADGRADLLLLSALALPLTLRADADADRAVELRALLDRLQFPAAERERVASAAIAVPGLSQGLLGERSPAALHEALAGVPIEAVALAGALDGEHSPAARVARRWLDELRHVRLQISGEDLLAAGVPGGPELGRRLHATLMRRLDGDLEPGREAELAAALEGRPR